MFLESWVYGLCFILNRLDTECFVPFFIYNNSKAKPEIDQKLSYGALLFKLMFSLGMIWIKYFDHQSDSPFEQFY